MCDAALVLQPQLMMAMNGLVLTQKRTSCRNKFLKAEDDLLRQLVEQYGESNWTLISSHMRRRTARQCRERYKNYLSPKVRNAPWTPEEEALLTKKVKEIGPKWAMIASYFDARSDVNVKNHWAAMTSRNERVERSARAKAEAAMKAIEDIPMMNAEDWDWPDEPYFMGTDLNI